MRRPIKQGKKLRVVWGDDGSGKFHGQDYYEKLSDRDRAKFIPLFERWAESGQIRNQDRFRKESTNIWAFKIHKQRLYGFRDGDDFVIVSGLTKNFTTGKKLKRAIEKAEKLRKSHLKEKKS